MPKFYVVEELCKQDGICASVCPAHVIKGPKGRIPVMRSGQEQNCLACGHCMAYCPRGAARVDTLPLEDMHKIVRADLPSPSAMEALLRARRSIRRFKKEPVERIVLEKILQATRHAPSAKNRRPVRWIVVEGREKIQEIGDCVAEWLHATCIVAEEPLMQEGKALHRAWRTGLDPLFRGAPNLVLAVTPSYWFWGTADAAIALTYLEIAALPHGVGACWAGYIATAARMYAPLQRLLGVQEGEIVSGGQMLGYIKLRPTACAPRLPLPVTWY